MNRSLTRSLLVLFSSLSLSVLAAGCAAEAAEEATGVDENAIVDVPQTDVERQSIGNCWIYAHASWVESMHRTATGQSFDISQSYWTYWHWFDQIAGGFSDTISTGGNWQTANNIVRKYGLMAERDFIAADTMNEMSSRQKQALEAINESLKSGPLKDLRRDKRIVRAELDRAWGLSQGQIAILDRVFGQSVSKTFAGGSATAEGTPILRAQDFEVAYTNGPGRAPSKKTLATAIGEWRQTFYSFDRRNFLARVQRAMHDRQPIIITWFVDFNALENGQGPRRGSFNADTLRRSGPGKQGGHMTVLEDYQARLADGTLLKAGATLDPSDPADRQLLDEALMPGTRIEFLRVKNSWGTSRPDRAFAPGMPGYHDLYLDYLDGPVKKCNEKNGETDTTDCPFNHTPLQDVVLPPGY